MAQLGSEMPLKLALLWTMTTALLWQSRKVGARSHRAFLKAVLRSALVTAPA